MASPFFGDNGKRRYERNEYNELKSESCELNTMTMAETKEKTPMLFQRLQVLGDLAVAGKLTNIMLHRVPQVKGWEGVKHPCLNSKDVTKNGMFATFFLLQALAMPLKETGWHEITCTFLSSKAQTKEGPQKTCRNIPGNCQITSTICK